jgi:hypothetical protein
LRPCAPSCSDVGNREAREREQCEQVAEREASQRAAVERAGVRQRLVAQPRGERQRVLELDGAQVADAGSWFEEAGRL